MKHEGPENRGTTNAGRGRGTSEDSGDVDDEGTSVVVRERIKRLGKKKKEVINRLHSGGDSSEGTGREWGTESSELIHRMKTRRRREVVGREVPD